MKEVQIQNIYIKSLFMKIFVIVFILSLLILASCKASNQVQTSQITAKALTEIQQETLEKGGVLQEWKEKIQKATGSNTEESKTAAECEALMKQKVEECSKHEGWSVNNAMEITEFATDEHYEFQDVKRQDCPGEAPGTTHTVHAETAFLDAQTDNKKASSYQVICSIGCNWWDCEEDLTGTWKGIYSEISDATYCKFKETGTKIFEIRQSGKSFRGTTEYSGASTVIGGEHCEGWVESNKGTISGEISENQVSGTMDYSGTKVPFTAILEGDKLSGKYAYSTGKYGAPFSGKGEFKLTKKS